MKTNLFLLLSMLLALVMAPGCDGLSATDEPLAPAMKQVGPAGPDVGDEVVTVAEATVYAQADVNSVPSGTQPEGASGIVENGPKTKSGNTWYRVDFDSGVDGLVLESAISEPGGGDPPTPPPPPSGEITIGYIGCSMTRDKGTGVDMYTSIDTWTKRTSSGAKVLQSYSGGGITNWGNPGENGYSNKWSAFNTGLSAWPATNVILWEICIRAEDKNVSVESYLDEVQHIAGRVPDNIPLYVVGQVGYVDGHVCHTIGENGEDFSQAIADLAVQNTRAQHPVGLVLGPLGPSTVKPDGCHANLAGMQLQAGQLETWIGSL